MSAVTPSAPTRSSKAPKLRIGFLRLTDAAPVIVAHEFGFFADEGVDTELFVEPSWANIADKLAFGFLDAAAIVPPLAFAIELGLRGAREELVIPFSLSLGGNTVTLVKDLADETRGCAMRERLPIAQAFGMIVREREEPPRLGVVHAYSTHNLLLRYWLAAAGVLPDRDVKLIVVPPARAVEALQTRQIAGFCAGAPWGEVARRAGVGDAIATSYDIWRNAPEKAFALRARWTEEFPDALQGALRALLRAALFCDQPENASYVAALLSRQKYLNLKSHAILASLPSGGGAAGNTSSFFRSATNFPWRSHALWFLREMIRWELVEKNLDAAALARRVYRPDLYRQAAQAVRVAAPLTDEKPEGAHSETWLLDASLAPIRMDADCFCDGAIFDPSAFAALHKFDAA